ncbi:hypothetical protein ACTA71_001705 [Dictyostelium dimigraforme]
MKLNNSFFFISVLFVFLIVVQFSSGTYSKSEIEYYKSLGYDLETGEFTQSSPQQQQQQQQHQQHQQRSPRQHQQRSRQNSRYSERRTRQYPNNEIYNSRQANYQESATLNETASVYKQGIAIPKNVNIGLNIDSTPNVLVSNNPTLLQSPKPIVQPTLQPTLPILQPTIQPTLHPTAPPPTGKPVEPEPRKTLPPNTPPPETIPPKPQTSPAITQHYIPTPSPQSQHVFYGDGRPAVADTNEEDEEEEEEIKKPSRTHKPINIDDDDDDDDEKETKKPSRSNNNTNNNNTNNHNNNNKDEDEDENEDNEKGNGNKDKKKNKGKPKNGEDDEDESIEIEEETITGSIEEAKTKDPNLIDGYSTEQSEDDITKQSSSNSGGSKNSEIRINIINEILEIPTQVPMQLVNLMSFEEFYEMVIGIREIMKEKEKKTLKIMILMGIMFFLLAIIVVVSFILKKFFVGVIVVMVISFLYGGIIIALMYKLKISNDKKLDEKIKEMNDIYSNRGISIEKRVEVYGFGRYTRVIRSILINYYVIQQTIQPVVMYPVQEYNNPITYFNNVENSTSLLVPK